MAAIDDLTAAVSALSSGIDRLIAQGAGSITPVQAQVLLTELQALVVKVQQAAP